MEAKLVKRLLCTILASVLLLVLLVSPLAVTDSSAGQASDAVTVTGVDQDKGLVIVRDHGTGETKQIKIDDIETLKYFKVGEVLQKPAGLEVQSRSAQTPPTTTGPGTDSCYARCRNAPGTTPAQCFYWCANR